MTPVSPADSVMCWPSVEQVNGDNEFEDEEAPPLPPRPVRTQPHERTISTTSSASEASQISTTFSAASSGSVDSDRTSLSSVRSVISIPLIPKRSPLRVVNDISSTMLKRLSMYSVSSTSEAMPSPLQPHSHAHTRTQQHQHNNHAGELPRESNNFRGLCKSAFLLQTGHAKAALKESKNRDSFIAIPGLDLGVGNVGRHRWVCRGAGCDFDGPVSNDGSSEGGGAVLDTTIHSRTPRVLFRWSFLFKSHLPHPSSDVERLRWYACVFCHARVDSDDHVGASGVYLGEEALLAHIEEAHIGEGKWPEGQVKERMGCVVGRPGMVGGAEEWDIFLPDWYGSSSGCGSDSGRSSMSAVEVDVGGKARGEAGGVMEKAVRRKPVGRLRVVT